MPTPLALVDDITSLVTSITTEFNKRLITGRMESALFDIGALNSNTEKSATAPVDLGKYWVDTSVPAEHVLRKYNAGITTWESVGVRESLFDSPALTGVPTAPTPGLADDSTKIATTAWVRLQNFGGASNAWTPDNDGAGSGLDADLFDGLQSTVFLRNDVSTSNVIASGVFLEFDHANATTNDGKIGAGIFAPGLNIVGIQTEVSTPLLRKIQTYGRINMRSNGASDPPGLGVEGTNTTLQLSNSDTTYGLLFGVRGSGVPWIQAQRVDGTATAYNLEIQPSGGETIFGGRVQARDIRIDSAEPYLFFYDSDTPGNYWQIGRSNSIFALFYNNGTTTSQVASFNANGNFFAGLNLEGGGSSNPRLTLRNTSSASYDLRISSAFDFDAWCQFTDGDGVVRASIGRNNQMYLGGAGVAGNLVWNDGNDGAGSGLDADLLDGIQGSNYLRKDILDTLTQSLAIRHVNPTIHFQDIDNRGCSIHNNSNLLYVLRGEVDSLAWAQTGGQWPFYWDLSNNNAVCGGSFTAVGNVAAYSDMRAKENFQDIEDPLSIIDKLKPKWFDWKKEYGNGRGREFGFGAQEIEEILPFLVTTERDHEGPEEMAPDLPNRKSLAYDKISTLAIAGIQKLKKIIEDQAELLISMNKRLIELEGK